MPELFLGIDTSNYTSSCAVYNKDEDSFVSLKKLLPVNEGQLGLRQSDAVFHHTKNLPPLLYELVSGCNEISCVSASFAPCDREGSYMPCFSVGQGFGKVLSGAYNSKYYEFSHQAGHVAAAIHSSGHTELIDKEFLAFHVSGGTTEILYVKPDTDKPFEITNATGCFMFFRTSVFTELGGFDERFFMYLEDCDIARRTAEKYKALHYPMADVIHLWERESKRNKKLLLIHIQSILKYFLKWGF